MASREEGVPTPAALRAACPSQIARYARSGRGDWHRGPPRDKGPPTPGPAPASGAGRDSTQWTAPVAERMPCDDDAGGAGPLERRGSRRARRSSSRVR